MAVETIAQDQGAVDALVHPGSARQLSDRVPDFLRRGVTTGSDQESHRELDGRINTSLASIVGIMNAVIADRPDPLGQKQGAMTSSKDPILFAGFKGAMAVRLEFTPGRTEAGAEQAPYSLKLDAQPADVSTHPEGRDVQLFGTTAFHRDARGELIVAHGDVVAAPLSRIPRWHKDELIRVLEGVQPEVTPSRVIPMPLSEDL